MEPWSKPTDRRVNQLRERLGDPFLFGLTTSIISELNNLTGMPTITQRYSRLRRELLLLSKEESFHLIIQLIQEVGNEYEKSFENRVKEINLDEIFTNDKPKEKTKLSTSVLISNIAKKRYGLNLVEDRGTCPFHSGSNKTSFMINDDTNTFRCWSCGESGNLIHFIKLMEERNGKKRKGKV